MTDMPVPPRTHNADAAADLGFVDLGFAKVDIERRARQGFPEVIFGQGKTPEQMVAIAQEIHRRDGFVLATRVSAEGAHALRQCFPDASWHEQARVVQIGILPGVVARADQCGLRHELSGADRRAGDAQLVRLRRDGGEH